MASEQVRSHLGVLEYLRDLDESHRIKFIKTASPQILRVISELALNLLHSNIKVSNENLQKLKKHKNKIIKLSQRKHSTQTRRNLLSMRGGLLGTFLAAVVPSVISAIIAATQRKK